MYERLTKWEIKGCASVNGCSPIDKDMANAINRLCEIEDKICEGRMVELPCNVGQTIYVLTTDSPTGIEETKISQVIVRFKGNSKPQYSILAPCVYDDWGKAKWSFCDNNFGIDFFFDRAEAEAKANKKLKELENEETDK